MKFMLRKLKTSLILIVSVLFLYSLGATTISPAHAIEDELKGLQKDYFDFSGGLNTKASDFLVSQKEATVLTNARFNPVLGGLTKRKPLLSSYSTGDDEITTSIYRFYKSDGTKTTIATAGNKVYTCDDSLGTCSSMLTLTTSGKFFTWTTWQDLAIGCDGSNSCVKTDGTDATFLGTLYAEDAGSGAGPDGDYTYKVTFYTTSYEVSLDTATATITVVDNDINLSMIPFGPSTYLGESILGRKIYRTSDGGSDYKLLTNGDIADNTTTTLTDSDTDAARGAALSPDVTAPTPKARFIAIYNNRIFIGNNPDTPSRLYFSEDGEYDYFPPTYLLDIRKNDGDQITFVGPWLGNFVVGKDNSWQYVFTSGSDPLVDWSISDPYTAVGCRYPYSAKITPYGIFFLSNNGIYNFNGQFSLLLSEKVTPTIEDIDISNRDNIHGAYAGNVYYLSYTSVATGATANDRILLYDTLSKAFSVYTVNALVMTTFKSGSDNELLFVGDSITDDIYAFDNTVFEIIHKEQNDFTGTFTNARYIPTRWGGDSQNAKLEISWDKTIDELTGTIDTLVGVVDREVDNGTYISQYLNTAGINEYERLYWNETLPSNGSDVTFALRSGATTGDCLVASWSSEFTNSNGDDVSAVSADTITQYRVSMTTDTLTLTPNVLSSSGYVIKLTYNKTGSASETSVPFQYTSGWDYMNYPAYLKELKKVEFEYEGEGTLNFTVTNELDDTDVFAIDLDNEGGYYQEFFTDSSLVGARFKFDVEKNDNSDLVLKRFGVIYDVDKESVNRLNP